ncbi:MAG: ribonuclease P protein component [Candidatus Peregrinibacteria bacterium]|nr:ribonuclease P protein component [Candidatus Peregrinibacteria bacterium]
MLAQKYRVPRQYIDYILKKGESYTSKFFIVRYKPNREGFCRFRIIISKKVDPKAVKRNHLRRQGYEGIRLNLPEVTTSGLDMILIVKKNALKASYQSIEDDLKNNIINRKNG